MHNLLRLTRLICSDLTACDNTDINSPHSFSDVNPLPLCLHAVQQYAIFSQAVVLCGGEKTANLCLTATAMTKRANFPFLCLFLPRRGFIVDVSTLGRKPGWYVYFHSELLASPRKLSNTPKQSQTMSAFSSFTWAERRTIRMGHQHSDGHSVCEEGRGLALT